MIVRVTLNAIVPMIMYAKIAEVYYFIPSFWKVKINEKTTVIKNGS